MYNNSLKDNIEILNDNDNNSQNETNSEVLPNRNNTTQIRCDIRTVRILRSVLSGRDGLLTNLGQTWYGVNLWQNSDLNFASTLSSQYNRLVTEINNVAQRIIQNGGTPRLSNGDGMFWSARAINYATNKSLYINNLIRLNQRTIRLINRLILRSHDTELNSFMQSLISSHTSFIDELRRLGQVL